MAKLYDPNEELKIDANTATACGMSYGDWRAKGCPEPNGENFEKIKHRRHYSGGRKKRAR